MKINKDFTIQKVGASWVAVPVGEASRRFHGMLQLNETGAFLWKLLETETTQEAHELPEQMQALYEARIADLWRIIDKITEERRILFITMMILILILVAFVGYLFLDGMHGNWGFFQY